MTLRVVTADVTAAYPPVWSELVNQAANTPVSQPAVPATGVAQYNNAGQAVVVTVTGGTVTVIAVSGVTTGLTTGAVVVPAGGSITLTYSVAPTWAWAALVAASGASPAAVQVAAAAPAGGQAGTIPQVTWRRGMVLDVPVGSALETAIGAGNLRAFIDGTDTVGHYMLAN